MNTKIIVLLALLNEKNEVLVSLRKNRADHNGFWEYPGGKVEEGENIDQALIREVKEELNIEISKHCVAPLTFALDKNERDKNNEAIRSFVDLHKVAVHFRGSCRVFNWNKYCCRIWVGCN